jgi:metallophosphoesterase superfamily enzyme
MWMRLFSKIVFSTLCLAFTCGLQTSKAADPASAEYSNDNSKIFWIVHISDTHIGSEWHDEDSRFFWLIQEALPIIRPELVVNTGDLCDGSKNGIPATGQTEGEWSRYKEILDISGLPADYYVDIPGNHDGYGDPGMTYYLEWSMNGSNFNKTTRALNLEFPFGNYFVFGSATPDEEGRLLIESPEYSQAELDEMEAELSANEDAELIFVFGHHRADQPENVTQARGIWSQYGAVYFHGHSHVYKEYMQDGIMVHEVNSLGKATGDNVAVIAVDNNYIAYDVTDSDDPWPFIVVTAPADIYLRDGEEHPYSYSVCNSAEANPVRALVFDRVLDLNVTFRVDDGPKIDMVQNEVVPMLWEGIWDTRDLPEGEVELVVSAEGTEFRSRTITVRVDDVPCPDPYQPQDGGDQDGSADDGTVNDGGEVYDAQMDADSEDGQSDQNPVDADGGFADSDQTPAAGGCGCATQNSSRPYLPLLLVLLINFVFLNIRRQRS